MTPGWAAASSTPRCSNSSDLGVDDLLVGHMHGNESARRFYERRGFTPFVHLLYAKRPGAEPDAGEGT